MNKQISPKIVSVIFSVLVICFAVGFYTLAVWTEPTTAPPGGNVDAPINVGGNLQIKQGPLGVHGVFDAHSTTLLASQGGNVGIGTPEPNSTKGESGYIDTKDIYLRDIEMWASELGAKGYTCQNTPIYDSVSDGVAAKPGWSTLDMPWQCRTSLGCALKVELYKTGPILVDRKFYDYNQDVSTNKWWSSYQKSGGYTNGDTKSTNIIQPRTDNNILLRDDSTATGGETNALKWSPRDNSSSYGQRIYMCLYSAEDYADEETEVVYEDYTCQNTPTYDSVSSGGVAAKPGWSTLDIPDQCRSENGCALKVEFYKSTGMADLKFYTYFQDSDNKWISSYQTGGFTNGDTTSTNVIQPRTDNNILLRDDSTATGGETSALKWSPRDNSSSYGQKIYMCF